METLRKHLTNVHVSSIMSSQLMKGTMTKILDITGEKYGLLTALVRTDVRSGTSYKWLCKCDCGYTCSVASNNLRTGHTTNCGCVLKAKRENYRGNMPATWYEVYSIWAGIKERCNNPNSVSFVNYGAKGVKMQESWESCFELFFKHIGPRPSKLHSVDRILNSLGYIEGNVRWATSDEQGKNKSMYKNNKTGLTGVHISNKRTKKGADNWVYVCTWYRLDGTQANRNFSIKKYGLLPAMCMAYTIREQEIKRMKMEEGYSQTHGDAKDTND